MNKPYTTSPLSIATHVSVEPEFLRLPKGRERDPIFGLSRSCLNELILPTEGNEHRPPVRSVVLRKRGARTGVRLVDIASLRRFLDQNVEPTYQEPTSGGVSKADATQPQR